VVQFSTGTRCTFFLGGWLPWPDVPTYLSMTMPASMYRKFICTADQDRQAPSDGNWTTHMQY